MLTDTAIRKLPVPEADKLIGAGGRDGLYLMLRRTGRRTWMLRRRLNGQWRVETLDDWPKLTALNARRRATMTETRVAEVVTFGDAADQFYRQAIEGVYRSSPNETQAYLVRDCASIASRRLDRVTRADIVQIIRAKSATPNAQAKLLAVLKKFTAWAQLGGLIEDDPCIGLTGKRLSIPAQQPRKRKLSDDELVALFKMEDEPYGRLLRFALLTGCRIGEAMQFEPDQVDGDVWTVPMTKNGKPHSVPLSKSAAAIAKAGWPARSYNAVFSHLVATGIGWRPHDLRRTAATRMRDAGVAADTIEAVLNHAPPKLQGTYQQPDMVPAMRDALARLDVAVAAVIEQGGAQREAA
ncbi:MAG: tyrosine-type recombinase/integrase [bacterium]